MTTISTPIATKKLRESTPAEKFASHGRIISSTATTNSIAPCSENGNDLHHAEGKARHDVSRKMHGRQHVAERRLLPVETRNARADGEKDHHRVVDDAVARPARWMQHVRRLMPKSLSVP